MRGIAAERSSAARCFTSSLKAFLSPTFPARISVIAPWCPPGGHHSGRGTSYSFLKPSLSKELDETGFGGAGNTRRANSPPSSPCLRHGSDQSIGSMNGHDRAIGINKAGGICPQQIGR